MCWIECNPNPLGKRNDDCAIRALALALNMSWDDACLMLDSKAFSMKEPQNSHASVNAVLREHGFIRSAIPNTCPDCYTVGDFAKDHPKGVFVLGCYGHVVTVRDGNVCDAWDSSQEIPQIYWYKEEENNKS